MSPGASPRAAVAGVALEALPNMQWACRKTFARPAASSWLSGGHHLHKWLTAHLLLCAKYLISSA